MTPFTPRRDEIQNNFFVSLRRSYVALARALEEEANDKHLQSSHQHDKGALDHAEVDDAAFGAADGAEVAVLSGAEVLLASRDGRELAGELEDGLLEGGVLFGRGALLGGKLSANLVLDLGSQGVSNVVWVGESSGGRTAISKSTNFSAKVLISLLKQNS